MTWSKQDRDDRANGNSTYTFDSSNRITRAQDPRGVTINYGYDSADRRTSIQIQSSGLNRTISYAYDNDDRIVAVSDIHGTTTYTYNAVGKMLSVAYANGVTASYIYDSKNYHLLSIFNRNIQGEMLSFFKYSYDAAGNRLSAKI